LGRRWARPIRILARVLTWRHVGHVAPVLCRDHDSDAARLGSGLANLVEIRAHWQCSKLEPVGAFGSALSAIRIRKHRAIGIMSQSLVQCRMEADGPGRNGPSDWCLTSVTVRAR
jgi:hypothetical protein